MARKGSMKVPEYTPHVARTLPPEPDLLERLSLEHRQIQRLWTELQRAHRRQIGVASGPDTARLGDTDQEELAEEIIHALAEHEAVELDFLYPAAARVMTEEWANQAMAEHAEVRGLLEEVDGGNPEDEAVFQVLTEALTRIVAHMDEEEKVVFPIMRLVMTDAELVNPRRSQVPEPSSRQPEVIDLAAAEREGAGATGAENHNGEKRHNGAAGRNRKSRLRLRRR